MTPKRLIQAVTRARARRRAWIAFVAGAASALSQAPSYLWPILFLTFPLLVWLIDGAPAPRAAQLSRYPDTRQPRFSNQWAQGKTVKCAIGIAAMDDLEGEQDVKSGQRVDRYRAPRCVGVTPTGGAHGNKLENCGLRPVS